MLLLHIEIKHLSMSHKCGTMEEKHLSGLLLQLPAGIPATQLVVLTGGNPACSDSTVSFLQ